MLRPMYRKKVLRYPNQIVHAGRLLEDSRDKHPHLVPICNIGLDKTWHQMPDNQMVTCKKCRRKLDKLGYA